jgi:hypothetical protein
VCVDVEEEEGSLMKKGENGVGVEKERRKVALGS